MRVLVEIYKGKGHAKPEWVEPGDMIKFTHTAQIRLADGREIVAGPERQFTVSILSIQGDSILDSEYVPPDAGDKPWLAKTWDKLTGRTETSL